MRTIDTGRTKTAAPVGASRPTQSVAASELVRRILAEMHGFIGDIRCAGTERLVRAGVSMTNLHVLGLLSRHGEMPMSRLADVLDVSFSNATGLIDRMEEHGLVERVRVPDDRRIVLVRLTDSGNSTLEEVELIRRDLLERLLARLDEEQLDRLALCVSDIHGAAAELNLGLGSESSGANADGHDHDHAHTHRGRHAHATTYPLTGEHRRPNDRSRTGEADIAPVGPDGPAA